jgi:lysophospholipase L1-like esterase
VLEATKKIGAILFGILIGVGLSELVLVWIDYNYTPLRIKTIESQNEWRFYHAFQDKDFVYDPDLIWSPRKGIAPFNSQGYRAIEITPAKTPGSIRIFTLGDSNTLGGLGKNDPSWPTYLEDLLRRENNDIQIINAGVYGYSSFQGLRRFQQALKFQPDLVLISFGWNDALQVTFPDAEFAARPIRTLQLDAILLRLRLGQLVLAALDSYFLPKKEELVPRVSLVDYDANLTKIAQLAKRMNIKVVLLTRPTKQEQPSPYDLTTIDVATKTGVPLIDIYQLFRERHEYFQDTSHFNAEGHRKMAKIIYERIKPLL